MSATAHYERVLLKISGEAFCQVGDKGIDSAELELIAREILAAQQRSEEHTSEPSHYS